MARYSKALDAKPGKGPISEDGIAAITDSVCDVPQLLAEIDRLRLVDTYEPEGVEIVMRQLQDLRAENDRLRQISNVNGDWNVKFLHEQAVTRDAVARAEAAEELAALQNGRAGVAEAERDRLARWKSEAWPVMEGMQDLGKALGLPLGERITGPAAVEAADVLRAELDELREQNQRFAARLGGYATTMQGQLDPLFQMLGKLRALVSDWQANGNSRPLGDPTAATWQTAALQLLRVLDGKDPNHG